MLNLIAIFTGGGVGAVTRYLISLNMAKHFQINLPFATFAVNIIGSFIIGFLYFLFIEKADVSPALKLALTAGFAEDLQHSALFLLSFLRCLQIISLFMHFLML